MKPLKTTRLFPRKKTKYFFRVFIWNSLKELRKQRAEFDKKKNVQSYAFVFTWNKPIRNQIGEIHFSKKYCGAGIQAHEMTHAALHYLRLAGWDSIDLHCKCGQCHQREEWICETIEKLCRDFNNFGCDSGVFKPLEEQRKLRR